MKRIAFIIFLIIAVWLGVKLAQDPGYLLIVYQHWTIEMPLWLGVVLIGLVFLFLYGSFRLFYHLKRTGKYLQFWSKKSRRQRAIEKTYLGFLDVINGRFKSGEKKLLHAAGDSPFRLINYLSAAKAAFSQKAYGRSENYLNQALKKEPEAVIAVGITKATLEIEAKAWQDALITLKPLDAQAPNNPNVLALLKVVYQNIHAWEDLIKLLPRLKKSPLESKDSIHEIEHEAYLEWLKASSVDSDVWSMLPKYFQRDATFVHIYVEKLLAANDSTQAEFILRRCLKREWNEPLIELYGKVLTDKPGDQLYVC